MKVKIAVSESGELDSEKELVIDNDGYIKMFELAFIASNHNHNGAYTMADFMLRDLMATGLEITLKTMMDVRAKGVVDAIKQRS